MPRALGPTTPSTVRVGGINVENKKKRGVLEVCAKLCFYIKAELTPPGPGELVGGATAILGNSGKFLNFNKKNYSAFIYNCYKNWAQIYLGGTILYGGIEFMFQSRTINAFINVKKLGFSTPNSFSLR